MQARNRAPQSGRSESLLAFHVAAHAVMQMVLERPVSPLSIEDAESQGLCAAGEMELSKHMVLRTVAARGAAMRDCLYLLAGWAVEQIAHTPDNIPTPHATYDLARAIEVLRRFNLTPSAFQESLRSLKENAYTIVGKIDTFYRIQVIATAVDRGGVVPGSVAEAAVAAAEARVPGRMSRTKQTPVRVSLPFVHPRSPRLRRVRTKPPITHQPMEAQPLSSPSLSGIAGETPLSVLRLSPFTLGTLEKRGGIHSVEQLLRRSADDLQAIRTLGAITLAEIRDALLRAGYEPGWR